ncbi:hypothetical protein Tco_1304152 [Tanacetum coccineum]
MNKDSFTWNEEAARAFSHVQMHTKSLSQALSEVVLVLVHLYLDMIYHATYATFVLRVIVAHLHAHETTVVDLIVMYFVIYFLIPQRSFLATDLLDHLPSGIKERAFREPLCDLLLVESLADVALVLLPYRGLPFPNESFIQVVTLAKSLKLVLLSQQLVLLEENSSYCSRLQLPVLNQLVNTARITTVGQKVNAAKSLVVSTEVNAD